METELILPMNVSLDAPFERQIGTFIALAALRMPKPSEAALLRAGAGGREDQQVLADYCIGMIWLTWRFNQAWPRLDSALNNCASLVDSKVFLRIHRQAAILKHLPLFSEPRSSPQAFDSLMREAKIIAYLRTGRID